MSISTFLSRSSCRLYLDNLDEICVQQFYLMPSPYFLAYMYLSMFTRFPSLLSFCMHPRDIVKRENFYTGRTNHDTRECVQILIQLLRQSSDDYRIDVHLRGIDKKVCLTSPLFLNLSCVDFY